LEAARRLEQIYLDDYATGNPAGNLRIWFAVKAEPREQTTFLLEVENRAVEAVFRKLKEDASHHESAAAGGGGADAAREFVQDIERWHDEAGSKARTGINWPHDWGARPHAYKPGQASRELARIGKPQQAKRRLALIFREQRAGTLLNPDRRFDRSHPAKPKG
jgi:hypothetical protein